MHPHISFRPLKEQQALQVQRINETLRYLSTHAPFYKKLWHDQGVANPRITHLSELPSLPTTTKEMMQRHNEDFLCVPRHKVVEYTATSGTLGKPVTIALTEKDLQRLAYNEQQSFLTAGITSQDVVQLLLTLDKQFMAGMAYYLGLRNIGASTIRTGPGVPAMQWEIAQRLQATAWVAVPSFVVKLLAFAQEQGIDYKALGLQKIVCIGEPLRNEHFELNALARRITAQWDVTLHSTYASTEMQSAFTECNAGKGGHLQPDILVLEILDDEGRQLPEGEVGEVTVTTLGIEGMPLLRYRTGDLAAHYNEPCSCGRHSVRLGPIVGRKQQMLKVKGTTLYPPALMDVMNAQAFVQSYVMEVRQNEWGQDDLWVYVHLSCAEEEGRAALLQALQARLRLRPTVICLSHEELQRLQFPDGSRKMVRWMDKRR